MRCCLYTPILLLLATPLCAADLAKANTLTPKEIADGWILLFDGETTFGWQVNSSTKKARLKVSNGALDLSDLGKSKITCTTVFREFELRFECAGAEDPMAHTSFRLHGTDKDGGKHHMQLEFAALPKKWQPAVIRVVDGELDMGQVNPMNQPRRWWKHLTSFEFEQSDNAK